ncbi:MAG: hypothetical protein JHC30_06150 [Caldisericum sp.]|nr:hypothetical protein [Caldisericum sp.]
MKNNINEQMQTEEFNFQESVLFDKAILVFSGAMLGVSLFLMNFIYRYVPLLLIAWVCFILSIVSTLLSMLISQDVIREKAEYLKGLIDYPENHALIVLLLNRFSMSFFITGAFFLTVFLFANL